MLKPGLPSTDRWMAGPGRRAMTMWRTDSTTYTDDNQGGGALPEGTYNYRVAAYDGECVSLFSNTSQAVMSYEPCIVDQDGDGDVDGADLAAMALNFDGTCLKAMAESLGTH